ncbi:MAG: NUDIX domain-containing protein, partial [Pseudomonadota bacterium]|nr:NUDIX domain-containing protein [Pseudomonadota bacterium]
MSVNLESKPWVDVAIGLLTKDNKVCLSLRQSHQHLADHWEFPGGKIEQDESAQQALIREFKEELGVEASAWQPLITIPWHYEKVSVRLQVFQTDQFKGEPTGLEGQKVEWCPIVELANKYFPEANNGILMALNLPDYYMSVGAYENEVDCLNRFQKSLESGVKLVQFKSKGLSEEVFVKLGNQLA